MIRAAALAALGLAAATPIAAAATDAELRGQIVGSWGKDAECLDGSLTFNADGTFALTRPGIGETGSWNIAGGVLDGRTEDGSSRPAVPVAIDGDSLGLGTGEQAEQLVPCSE